VAIEVFFEWLTHERLLDGMGTRPRWDTHDPSSPLHQRSSPAPRIPTFAPERAQSMSSITASDTKPLIHPLPGVRGSLLRADKIGLIGDVHGRLDHLLTVLATFRAREIHTVVQLGDFGLVWSGCRSEEALTQLNVHLTDGMQTLLWVDGNHEDHVKIKTFPIGDGGIRWIRPRVGHLPRGYQATLTSGRTIAVLVGANSIDFEHRIKNRTWWAEESITDEDLTALGSTPADILFGHDAPMHVPDLDRFLNPAWWSPEALRYAAARRSMFHRGFIQVRPQLSVSGHYHQWVDNTVTYTDQAGDFTTRVVVLDKDGRTEINPAILDITTLQLEFMNGNGHPPSESSASNA
jgi:predicted phosphodiesterase